MSDSVRVHIGAPEDMGRRFADAWHRAERGEAVSETNVTFRDLETLCGAGRVDQPGIVPGAARPMRSAIAGPRSRPQAGREREQ